MLQTGAHPDFGRMRVEGAIRSRRTARPTSLRIGAVRGSWTVTRPIRLHIRELGAWCAGGGSGGSGVGTGRVLGDVAGLFTLERPELVGDELLPLFSCLGVIVTEQKLQQLLLDRGKIRFVLELEHLLGRK